MKKIQKPLSDLRVGEKFTVTLSGTVEDRGYGGLLKYEGGKTSDLSWLIAAAGTGVEATVEVEEYKAQEGDVVRLHWSNGRAFYAFDGTEFVPFATEPGFIGDTGHTQSRATGERMVRSGVKPGGGYSNDYTVGGEHLLRDGKPVTTA